MTTTNYWQYNDFRCPQLNDPRVEIVKHIGWVNPNSATTPWNSIEPDCYTHAVFADQPMDLDFIKDQCWYKVDTTIRRQRVQGWISAYYTEDNSAFEQAVNILRPRAVWRCKKPHPIRPRRTLMEREQRANQPADKLTTEERLWQLGYFNVYKHKYLDDEAYLKVVGLPRGIALDPILNELDHI